MRFMVLGNILISSAPLLIIRETARYDDWQFATGRAENWYVTTCRKENRLAKKETVCVRPSPEKPYMNTPF